MSASDRLSVARDGSDINKQIFEFFRSGDHVVGWKEMSEYMYGVKYSTVQPTVFCVDTKEEFEFRRTMLLDRCTEAKESMLVDAWVKGQVDLKIDYLYAPILPYKVVKRIAPFAVLYAVANEILAPVLDVPVERRKEQLDLRLAVFRCIILLINTSFCLGLFPIHWEPEDKFLAVGTDFVNGLSGVAASDIDAWCFTAFSELIANS